MWEGGKKEKKKLNERARQIVRRKVDEGKKMGDRSYGWDVNATALEIEGSRSV